MPHFLVSAFDLGSVAQTPPTTESVVERLNRSEWCTAAAQVSRLEWNEVPPGADPARWLSVVAVGFGKQAEAYIFQFDGPNGGARLVAHYPHRKRLIEGNEIFLQITPQLLEVFQINVTRGAATPGVPLQLEIVEAAGAVLAEPAGIEEALSLPPKAVLPPLRAIIAAAACSQGWAPAAKPASARAKVEVRVLDRACSFRLTLERDGKQSVFTRERVPWEEFHVQLGVLFRMPALGDRVVDFIRPGLKGVELLGSEGNRSFLLINGELAALDPNAQEVWRLRSIKGDTRVPAKKPDYFTARREDSGRLRLFGWGSDGRPGVGSALVEISPADGKTTPLAADASAGAAPCFDVDASGAVALSREGRVVFFKAGKELWSATEPAPVKCGPRIETDRVLFGSELGELVALDRSDGKQLWRVQGGARLWGRIVPAGGLRLAFSNEEESLLAFDPMNGTIQWRFAAGDALVQPPFLHEGSLVAATKHNRIVRLDPGSGALQAEAKMPAWILDVRAISTGKRNLLALNDASGRVVVLDAGLKPIWEASTGARNTGCLALAQLRPQWKPPKKRAKDSAEEIVEDISAGTEGVQPFILCSDSKGFLYKISIQDVPK